MGLSRTYKPTGESIVFMSDFNPAVYLSSDFTQVTSAEIFIRSDFNYDVVMTSDFSPTVSMMSEFKKDIKTI